EWIRKLDISVKSPAGQVNSYVYRLRYARSETIAMAIMALYSNNPFALVMLSAMQQMNNGVGSGGGGYGGGMAGGGFQQGGRGMMMGMMGGMMGGGYGSPGGYGAYPGMGYPGYGGMQPVATSLAAPAAAQPNFADAGLTGQYLGN